MRRGVIAAAILLQALALAWVVAERESVLRNGTLVYLRTAPVDPRDPLRGDYVQLVYDANHIPLAQAEPGLAGSDRPRDERVYVPLSVDARQLATATGVSRERPANGLYLRGYTAHDWRLRGNDQQVAVRYGIEKLFVEQGAGKLIEEQRGERDDWQRPMEVAVAVGDQGIGVIRDFRWAPYAARLAFPAAAMAAAADETRPTSPRVQFAIRNDDSAPMVLLNPGTDCGFQLQAADGQAFTPATDACSAITPSAGDFITLAPGETYTREFDLREPRWHIRLQEGNKPPESGEIGSFDNFQRFRLVYTAPPLPLPAGAPAPWQGSIRSPAFSARGRID